MMLASAIIIVPYREIVLSHHSWLLLMDDIVGMILLAAASVVRFRSQVGLRDSHVLYKLADGRGGLVLEQLGGRVL